MFYMFYFAAAGAEIAATSHSCSVRLHLNLPTQPRLKLLTDDPHTAVSVAEAAFKRILQLGTFRFECSRWQHTEQPDWGGKSWNCRFTKFFFWLSTALRGRTSLSLSIWKYPPLAICPTVCGYEPIDTEVCSPSSGAVTHQGAVVQQGCGEVAAEAERQDVALPGAEGHLAFWKRQTETATLVCKRQPRLDSCSTSNIMKVVLSTVILTAQPWHTGVVNFELCALQVLHGEVRTEQQVGFIFRGKDTEVISSWKRTSCSQKPGFCFHFGLTFQTSSVDIANDMLRMDAIKKQTNKQ